MKPELLVMKELMNLRRRYAVSCHHRRYVWEEQQWDAMWTPIAEIAKSDRPSSHFLGIVLTQIDPSSDDIQQILLLDGQQRIVTAFILIALWRDWERANGEADDAKKIQFHFLTNFSRKEDPMKLMLHESDQAAFECLIHNGRKVANSQIFKAYDFFEKKIKESRIPVERIMNVVLNFKMVNIVVEENDDAHQIWETLVS